MELEKIKNTLDKKLIQQIAANEAKDMLDAAEKNPLLLRIEIKRMIEFLTTYDKCLDDAVREEAEKEGQKSYEFHGAKVELAEVGTKYDYSKDKEWNMINEKLDPILSEKKSREEFLKKLPKPFETIDSETGEVITVYPAAKSSKSSVKITI